MEAKSHLKQCRFSIDNIGLHLNGLTHWTAWQFHTYYIIQKWAFHNIFVLLVTDLKITAYKQYFTKIIIPHLYQAKNCHRLHLCRNQFQVCDECKQVQIPKIWKMTRSIFIWNEFKYVIIDLQLLCSVNESHNQIHVHQASHVTFCCTHSGYGQPQNW